MSVFDDYSIPVHPTVCEDCDDAGAACSWCKVRRDEQPLTVQSARNYQLTIDILQARSIEQGIVIEALKARCGELYEAFCDCQRTIADLSDRLAYAPIDGGDDDDERPALHNPRWGGPYPRSRSKPRIGFRLHWPTRMAR